MELVEDTPAKRRKLANGDSLRSQAYDSQSDSGDDIFADYETVATVPLAAMPVLTSQNTTNIPSSPAAYVTQPTQIVTTPGQGGSRQKPSIVQVAGSSPARKVSPSPATSRRFAGGKLASNMAPAGTAFQPPKGIVKALAAPIVDISDDEPFLRNSSSDDDSESGRRACRADIKPSTFTHSGQKPGSKIISSGSFKEILSNSFYKPLNGAEKHNSQGSTLSGSVYDQRNRNENQTTSRIGTTSKLSADTMANAYGATRRPPKQVKQTGPAKALPATELDIDDIEDYQLRSKINRMRQILPHHGVRACKDALERKKYNFDDAMELLACQEPRTTQIDLTSSDGEDPLSTQAAPKRAPAKQQIKAPNLKIQDKWTATQTRNIQASNPLTATSPTAVAPKPRRRLVQGRRQRSSPIAAPKQPSPIPSSRSVTPDPDDSDSGVGTGLDSELDDRVLSFLNTCSIPDLVDLVGITEEVASVLLTQRPFGSLDDVRQVSSDIPGTTKTKRKTTRKPFGDKIVDKCLSMWTGYEAIDELVKRCEDLAKPVKEDMKAWGVNIFGAATEGELELVSFERVLSPRDSAIGTPNSIVVSDEEGDVKKIRRHTLFPQPSLMAPGIQLKDYQVSPFQNSPLLRDPSKGMLTVYPIRWLE